MSIPILYHTDQFGAFTGGMSPARRSPADKDEVWLVSEGATIEPPPSAGEGEVAVLLGGRWSVLPDHRGRMAYEKGTLAARKVYAPGPLPDGETLVPPPSAVHRWTDEGWGLPLIDARALRLLEVGTELSRRNAVGFTFDGRLYQLDDGSQARISALAVLAQVKDGAEWPDEFNFIAADNSAVPFTATDFVTFATAAAQVVIARQLNARSLKDQILAVVDAAALAAIDITTGWD